MIHVVCVYIHSTHLFCEPSMCYVASIIVIIILFNTWLEIKDALFNKIIERAGNYQTTLAQTNHQKNKLIK